MSAQHTPGPWRWEFNKKSKQIQLCGGDSSYDLTVMDFTRYGMGGAAPRFREDVDRMCIMERVEKFAQPVEGREHHKSWFQDINHPDARLIAAAPDLLEAFKVSLIRAYSAGYQHGHEATVESEFIPIPYSDIEFHEENIHQMLCDGSLPEATAAIAKAKGEP